MPGRVGFGQASCSSAPTRPSAKGTLSTSKRIVSAAVCHPLAASDPKIDPAVSSWICCGPVSRGVAAWHGKIIIATLDGRLIALDARSGKPVWSANTVLDKGQPITITGAPRIADGNVVIGNAGGDLGARGYISAWNADTGKHVWTFWIVPPQPGKIPSETSG